MVVKNVTAETRCCREKKYTYNGNVKLTYLLMRQFSLGETR